jgi:hypothetical protein
MYDRGLTDALQTLIDNYAGGWGLGIDRAIDTLCGDHALEIREQVREEDARIARAWPATLGRYPWELEASFGKAAVLKRLRRMKRRLKSEQTKQANAGEAAVPDGAAAGRVAPVL